MKLSDWGLKLGADAGIVDLMEDLGQALNVNPDLLFLGGGNPAHVPAFEAVVARHLDAMIKDSIKLRQLIGIYQSPRGSEAFIGALVDYVNQELCWGIREENVALTTGSQAAFFILLNMFAGSAANRKQNAVFPMMPDYLGYADQTLETGVFRSYQPTIEHTSDHRFKYHVDFNTLELTDDDGVLCVSRPTNPTGNVLSNETLSRLSDLADDRGLPFVIDCAYGEPFPGILYNQAPIVFDPRCIYVVSLSKLGLPGTRTGVVIGSPDVISRVVKANTVMSLANGNLGPAIVASLIQSGELASLCRHTLLPYYRKRRDFMLACLAKSLNGLSYFIHEPQGAFFVWLWLPDLPISSRTLYERMKSRGVLLMDGSHFFFGLAAAWPHANQCLRMTYCQSEAVIEQAVDLLGKELKQLMSCC